MSYAKQILLGITTVIGGLLLSPPIYATGAEPIGKNLEFNNTKHCDSPLLKQFGKIDREQTVVIEGKINPLYCTFVNEDYALRQLRSRVPNTLDLISSKYSLKEINKSNIVEYKNILNSLSDDSEFFQNNDELQNLKSFIDIYEGYSRNKKLLEKVETLKNKDKLSKEDKIEIGMLLPYYAPLAIEASSYMQEQLGALRNTLPDLNAAVRYAEKYAWTPNKNEYGVATSFSNGEVDCTNFASQILHASGVSQVVYNNKNSGWWHRKNWFGGHDYSISWINADVFARYMGVGYTTTNHQSFAQNIIVGDFIAFDRESNGTWDHMGFVTYRDNSERWYNGKYYQNYIVAQHTSNYNMWVSEEQNHWEFIGDHNGRYGRVRR